MRPSAPVKTCHVLYVEDSRQDQQILREAINFAGVPVELVTAPNAEAALQILSATSTPFHMLLVDWNLPAVTGLNFLGQLRSAHPSLPIVILTGEPRTVDQRAAASLNVRAVLHKPILLEDWEQLACRLYTDCNQVASKAIA
jgi:CheY-like chemotaxis protein